MDTMHVEILADGTIKIETDKISAINHTTAEALMRNVALAAGGQQTRKHKGGLAGELAHQLAHALGKAHSH
jgi:hypothetical protein